VNLEAAEWPRRAFGGIERDPDGARYSRSRALAIPSVHTGVGERLAVIASFFLGMGALISMFRLPNPEGDPWAGSDQDPLTRGIWLALYLVMIYLVAPHWREVVDLMKRNIWIPVLMLLVLGSAAWSGDPGLTARRAVAIDLGALYGYYLAVRFSTAEVVRLLRIAIAVALLLSVAFIVFLPSYGIYQDLFRGSTWRGVFLHKNPLGRAAALGVLLALLPAQWYRRRAPVIALSGVALVLLIGSASTTALLAAALPCVIAVVVYAARRLGGQACFALAILASAGVLGTSAFGPGLPIGHLQQATLTALGKDRTLTDRTSVWRAVRPEIAQKPWLGYGVSGFWRGWDGPSAAVWALVPWHPVHSHNGYLDLALDLGLVGLCVFVAGLFVIVRQALRLVRRRSSLTCLWALLFLAFLLVESSAESVLVRPNSIWWILYVFTAAAIAKEAAGAEGHPA
jgi:exopolysaccharide production protein ExoQ